MEARKEMIINTCLNYFIFFKGGEVQNTISVAPDFFKQIAMSSAVIQMARLLSKSSNFDIIIEF